MLDYAYFYYFFYNFTFFYTTTPLPGEEYTDFYSIYYRIVDNEFVYSTGDDETPELVLQVFDPLGNEVTSIEGLEYVTTSDGVKGFDITTAQEIYPVSVEYEIVTDGTAPTVQEWTFVLFFMNLETNQNINAGKLFESDITIQHETRDLEGRPSISAISNTTTQFFGTDVETSSLFEVSFSENNGTTVCEPEHTSELEDGTHTVSCTAIDNNGYKTTATKEVEIFNQLGDVLLLNESTSYNTLDSAISYIKNKNVSFITAAITDEGFYATEDDSGTSYYFRGAVTDNWVYFAGFYWRILRIDGVGNIKLIYSGTTKPTSDTAIMTGIGTQIGTSNFQDKTTILEDGNYLYHSIESIGYVYSDGKIRGTDKDSLAKNVVDTWYDTNLKPYESYISTSIYCLSRRMYNGSNYTIEITDNNINSYTNIQIYSDSGIYAKTATYAKVSTPTYYPNDDSNLTSLTCSANDSVSLRIGLISTQESFTAGTAYAASGFEINGNAISSVTTNNATYLYTGQNYWSLTPYRHSKNGGSYTGWMGYGNYATTSHANIATANLGLRPTISLNSDITITGGTGTGTDPYVIG
ncbi:MAG: hypothetical protein R3Y13_04310 [bacterium]